MKKIQIENSLYIEGGSWFSNSLDFASGVCAGTLGVRSAALLFSVAVPGSVAVWAGIGVGCFAIGIAAAAT
jgi:hypothetical protein